MRRRYAAFVPALALAVACSGGTPRRDGPPPPPPPSAVDAAPPAAASPTQADLERLADDVMKRAAAHEPEVSAILQSVAASLGGTMAGFEHRLKKRESTLRKIRKLLAKEGELSKVVIDDALRYTLQVEDTPPGNHATAIRAAFAALEKAGHKVIKVKNYWPRGDNYSGVNAVLAAPDGLPWELQFHTAASFKVKNDTHELYEEMREDATPVERKRVLYQQLAAPWESVPIPRDMLTPHALHPVEEIIQRPPP